MIRGFSADLPVSVEVYTAAGAPLRTPVARMVSSSWWMMLTERPPPPSSVASISAPWPAPLLILSLTHTQLTLANLSAHSTTVYVASYACLLYIRCSSKKSVMSMRSRYSKNPHAHQVFSNREDKNSDKVYLTYLSINFL